MRFRSPENGFKGIFEKFVFVIEQSSPVKVEELCVTTSRFPSFSEKYCRTISVFDVTDDLYSEYEADLHLEHTDFVFSEPSSQKVYFEDFKRIFRSLPCGTSRNK